LSFVGIYQQSITMFALSIVALCVLLKSSQVMGTQTCYSIVPYIPDSWCQGVECNAVYDMFCQRTLIVIKNPDDCKSKSDRVTDRWCQNVRCADVYSEFCYFDNGIVDKIVDPIVDKIEDTVDKVEDDDECIAGSMRIKTSSGSTKVRDLKIGNVVKGLSVEKKEVDCTIVMNLKNKGTSPTYGGFTKHHVISFRDQNTVVEAGTIYDKDDELEETYALSSDCPSVLNDKDVLVTHDAVSGSIGMTWAEHAHLWKAMYKVLTKTGAWELTQSSSWRDIAKSRADFKALVTNGILRKCTEDNDCDELEDELFGIYLLQVKDPETIAKFDKAYPHFGFMDVDKTYEYILPSGEMVKMHAMIGSLTEDLRNPNIGVFGTFAAQILQYAFICIGFSITLIAALFAKYYFVSSQKGEINLEEKV